jgi:hypothetical protein
MEIVYMDPSAYTSLAGHRMRQNILTALFKTAYGGGEVTKQELADLLGIKYQQLVYQLNSHLRDFWTVVREEKTRGTRTEYIAPAERNAIYIAVGKDRLIYIADPIAGIYGPLGKVGCRCDLCSPEEADHCLRSLKEKGIIPPEISEAETETLARNNRAGIRPLDRGMLEALRGLAAGDRCVLTIPCERCTFLRRKNLIPIE